MSWMALSTSYHIVRSALCALAASPAHIRARYCSSCDAGRLSPAESCSFCRMRSKLIPTPTDTLSQYSMNVRRATRLPPVLSPSLAVFFLRFFFLVLFNWLPSLEHLSYQGCWTGQFIIVWLMLMACSLQNGVSCALSLAAQRITILCISVFCSLSFFRSLFAHSLNLTNPLPRAGLRSLPVR